MINFHNPALVRTVTFNFVENYQNVTMLRILMSTQHKYVSYIVYMYCKLPCLHMCTSRVKYNWFGSISVTWNSSSLLHIKITG